MQFGRGAISGAEFAPSLPPPPPASSGGWAGPQLARSSLGSFSLSFVLPMAGSVFDSHTFLQLIFSLSLAIPQFKLPSQVSSLRLPSGHSGPVLTLSTAPAPLRSAPTCWWQMRVSGVLFFWYCF